MEPALEAALERARALLSVNSDGAAAEAAAVLAPWQERRCNHPHVPFLLGAALQRLNKLPEAVTAYESALALEPALIFCRVNLVHVLLSLQRLPAARSHAEEAVAREPTAADRHFLLSLVLMQAGDEAGARKALQRCLALDPRRVEAYVNLDALYLREGNLKACRALAALAIREAKRSGGAFTLWSHELQRPPHVRQGLRAQPWWDAGEFAWTAMLEANVDVIREEMAGLDFGHVGGRSAHDGSLVSQGAWREFVLFSGGGLVEANCRRCPRTAALLLRVQAAVACANAAVGEVLFSMLAPGSRLRPHCGSTNTRLTCHLGLVVPSGCELRVGDEARRWQEGKALVFDDSFEHEAHNMSALARVVLLINFFHPDLPSSEWGSLRVQASANAAPFRA